MAKFPFLFGGAFIEVGGIEQLNRIISNFPSFSEGLSLRCRDGLVEDTFRGDFPSFSEGLSLR